MNVGQRKREKEREGGRLREREREKGHEVYEEKKTSNERPRVAYHNQ